MQKETSLKQIEQKNETKFQTFIHGLDTEDEEDDEDDEDENKYEGATVFDPLKEFTMNLL